ncbi:hypothetical protein BsWGS_08372 [Bradybaena similaris]
MDVNIQQDVCTDFCFHLGKTGSETFEMLQSALGESCLSGSKTFEWYSYFKVGADPLKMTPIKVDHPLSTLRLRYRCKKSYILTDG